MIIIAGRLGSDAGWTWIDGNGNIHHEGGWAEEAMTDLRSAVAVIAEATKIKSPGVAQETIRAVHGLVQKELETHLGEGGVLILT
jgi:hypothetical protein